MVMFDEVLGITERALQDQLGGAVPTIHIIRDTTGAIVVVLPDDALQHEDWDRLAVKLDSNLGQYSPGRNRVLLKESDLIDPDDVLNSPDRTNIPAVPNAFLIDRMVTNQDWLRAPLSLSPPVPTAVAFSIKGGVGRSTAFAMYAWYLARLGKRALVVDLDLEAPGIGSILSVDLPRFGLIDWLTEDLNGQGNASLLSQCIVECPIGRDTDGAVYVLPAYGSSTQNYVAKLGRVYMPSLNDEGKITGLAERLQKLLSTTTELDWTPDVVLLDARAGLHDIGSAAVTRLGAEALLFARNDQQSWWAFNQLFDHLRTAKSVQHGMGNDDDLRWRLKMIAAQTEPNESAKRSWVQASYDAWTRFYDDEREAATDDFQPQVFDRWSAEAPHFPYFVNFDPAVRSLSLTTPDSKPDWAFIQGIFGEFFKGMSSQLWPTGENDQGGTS